MAGRSVACVGTTDEECGMTPRCVNGPSNLDLAAIKAKWLNLCGACDAGIGTCNHPVDDYRPVMLSLVEEIERLRMEVAAGSPDDWFAQPKVTRP